MPMVECLQSTDVIDWERPEVLARVVSLRKNLNDPLVIAKRCFEGSHATAQSLWDDLSDVTR